MKRYFFDMLQSALLTIVFALLLAKFSAAQSVAVNQSGAAAHSSAMLDITSTSKGILIPRLTTNQRTTIPSPATGLLVYDTDINSFMFYNGAGWAFIAPAGAPAGTEWKLQGNSGTDPSVNFIGTTDNMPLHLRVNDLGAGKLDHKGNAFYGYKAGSNYVSGYSNIAIGPSALYSNQSGSRLVAIGDSALMNNTGVENTSVGSKTLYSNTSGGYNSAFGFQALKDNLTGNSNSAFGVAALLKNTLGSFNSSFGIAALAYNISGSYNAAVGYHALGENTLGDFNTAVGASALYSNNIGCNNVALGAQSLYYNVGGNSNIAIGTKALFLNESKNRLIAIGDSSLYNNTMGERNLAIGIKSLFSNTTGASNTAIGSHSLFSNTVGGRNTAIGDSALRMNTSGLGNTAVGFKALASTSNSSSNSAFGDRALSNYSGSSGANSAFGNSSMLNTSTGSANTAIGYNSLANNTGGNSNTCIGIYALGNNTSGSYNTGLGRNADVGAANLSNATAIGAYAMVDASNSMVLGSINGVNGAGSTVKVGIGTTTPDTRLHVEGGTDANYTPGSGYLLMGNTEGLNIVMDNNEILARNNGLASDLFIQASGGSVKIGSSGAPTYLLELATNSAGKPGSNTWTIVSDARLKKEVHEFKDGLSVIKQVNPVWFRYNGDAGIKDTAVYVGILAQEIKKIAPYMVSENKHTDEKGIQNSYLNYDGNAMTYILINAIKELQQEIDDLKKQIKKD